MELAELFQTSIPNVNIHIKHVLSEGELLLEATVKVDLKVQNEGKRQIKRAVKLYNLDMILAVGYHDGLAPQSLLALRMIFGDKASLDVTGREYFVTSVGAKTSGHDNIIRTDLAFSWRINKQHAVSIKYPWNRRDATYTTLGDRNQSRTTFGIYYTLPGNDQFGEVDWR